MNKTDYNEKRALIERGESVMHGSRIVSTAAELDEIAESDGLTDAPDGTDALTLTRIVELESHLDNANTAFRAVEASRAALEAQLDAVKTERDELSEKIKTLTVDHDQTQNALLQTAAERDGLTVKVAELESAVKAAEKTAKDALKDAEKAKADAAKTATPVNP